MTRALPRAAGAVAFALLVALAAAPAGFAHARLEAASPPEGTVAKRAPSVVVFRFGEPVEGRLASVRVLDSRGRRIDDGRVLHPGGRSTLGARLLPDAARGTYTATYRLVSEDGHVVAGGSSFGVGRHSAPSAAAMPGMSGPPRAGPVTQTAFGFARGGTYLATALVVGLLAFLRIVWLPALDATAGGAAAWTGASAAFGGRLRRLLYGGIQVGVLAGVAGIVLEGATATGTSFWSALDDHVFRDVTGTAFGGYWALRIAAFVTLGAVLVLAGREAVVPELRPAALGAAGTAMPEPGPRMLLTVGLPVSVLVLVPALSGHAADSDPALMIPVDAAHVLAMSVWLGGLTALLAAVPVAMRRLETGDAHRLLGAVILRFSAVALAAVIVLVGTGIVQALEHVGSWSALPDTGYGRAVLVKIGITVALVGLGTLNRRRTVPALRRLARGEHVDGAPARLLRRTVAAEVLLIVAVLGVTSALVSYAPPAG